ncbi:hypothetical protein EJA72_09840 [Pseudomonas sp. PB120]|uniref:hypothetical protein n=1 Tax=Pseudomonas sp. PB120 TaxID=2494700 RepID=UPI0012FE1EB8|nr:hypothetical protein [Pseudomonas sp. PB120]MVV48538.1 hypothetical protein [Pseudomonas sp. PB120]
MNRGRGIRITELIVARLMAFRTESEDCIAEEAVLLEVVDFSKSGKIEMTLTATKLIGKPCIYLTVSLPDLLAKGMAMVGTNKP